MANGPVCKPQALKPLSLIHIGSWENSPFPLLALWGNKNGLPSMKVKKLEKFLNKIGLKGCKWSTLNAPGTETPQSHPYWELGEFPFPYMDKIEGFQCLGHSNWTTGSPLSPFCFKFFPICSPSYWGAHSYYPRGLILEKGNSPNSRNGCDRGVSVPGAFKLDHLQPFKPILF